MSDLFKSSSSPSPVSASTRKQEVMAQVKQEMALANAQELMNVRDIIVHPSPRNVTDDLRK